MGKLWIFGDSFSTDFDLKHCHQNHVDYMKIVGVNEMTHWPLFLADKLNLGLKNLAKGGNSNYQIFFDLCEHVNQIEENDVVLIGWALIGKFIIANKNEFSNIHPHDMYFHGPINGDGINEIIKNRKNEIWKNEVKNWELLIKETIRLKNAKVIFWSGEEKLLENNKIDTIKCPTMSSETNNIISDSHLGCKGHLELAENFYNVIINE